MPRSRRIARLDVRSASGAPAAQHAERSNTNRIAKGIWNFCRHIQRVVTLSESLLRACEHDAPVCSLDMRQRWRPAFVTKLRSLHCEG